MELGGFYVLASTNMMGTKTLQEILSDKEHTAQAIDLWGIEWRGWR